MSDGAFISYLIVTFISFAAAIFLSERKGFNTWWAVSRAVAGAVNLMGPLFYLVFITGMVASERYGTAMNLGLPLLWAHLGIFAWASGERWVERYAIGATFILTVPMLVLAAESGFLMRSRIPYTIIICNWMLFVIGFVPWLMQRFARQKDTQRPQ